MSFIGPDGEALNYDEWLAAHNGPPIVAGLTYIPDRCWRILTIWQGYREETWRTSLVTDEAYMDGKDALDSIVHVSRSREDAKLNHEAYTKVLLARQGVKPPSPRKRVLKASWSFEDVATILPRDLPWEGRIVR